MRILVTLILFLATCIGHAATQQRVLFKSQGQDVVATLTLPRGEAAPVVLLLHGFAGSRDELKTDHVRLGIFAHTALRLADQGFASLRIDFRGSGESVAEFSFSQTTFESQVADGFSAMAYLEAHPDVQGEDLYVIGWSQGGLVATALAGRSGRPDAVALWATVAEPRQSFSNLFGAETMRIGLAAKPDEEVPVELPWGEKISLKGSFFEGIEKFDPPSEIARYAGPLFVAQGSNDLTVMPRSAQLLMVAHEGLEEMWIADMDHVFNSFSTSEKLDEMIARTITFFQQVQGE